MRRLLGIALMVIVVISGSTAVAEDGEEVDVYEFDETEFIYPPCFHSGYDSLNLLELVDPVQPGSGYLERKSADQGVLRIRH